MPGCGRRRSMPPQTFNLAGLVGGYTSCTTTGGAGPHPEESSLNHYNMIVLSMHALMGIQAGRLRSGPMNCARCLTKQHRFRLCSTSPTTSRASRWQSRRAPMLFVDCTDWYAAHGKAIEDVEQACWDVGVAIPGWQDFHGPCHLRMNLASPRSASRKRSAGWIDTFSTPDRIKTARLRGRAVFTVRKSLPGQEQVVQNFDQQADEVRPDRYPRCAGRGWRASDGVVGLCGQQGSGRR